MFNKILGDKNSIIRIYAFSLIATVAALTYVGFGLGMTALFSVLVLCALEITFSFDNAVVNAKILGRMSAFWREMFMTVGIIIAVFGMRLVLPLVLVAVTANLDIVAVANLALANPVEYAEKLQEAHPIIASFGGMFLLMIFLEFMLDTGRDVHWVKAIERPLIKIGQLNQVPVLLSLIVLLVVANALGGIHQLVVMYAGVAGIVTFMAVNALAIFFEKQYSKKQVGSSKKNASAGLFSFLYLEILDASFSFDGVVGAFAITNSVILIAIGLGVGAVWVRSMTVHMVRKNTLSKFRYLEHGAHYAIGILAAVLLVGIAHEIPEIITGTVGIAIIGFAFWDSWRFNRKKQS
ncbi:MAG: DUF475 domain-containing protein [Candidatus Woesebacteria bacterium]|jgi:hypothetical protein